MGCRAETEKAVRGALGGKGWIMTQTAIHEALPETMLGARIEVYETLTKLHGEGVVRRTYLAGRTRYVVGG